MKRRAFSLATAAALLTLSQSTLAQSTGIKIRFVITRVITRPDGATDRASYENAVLLTPDEVFANSFDGKFHITLKASQQGVYVTTKITLRDLELRDMPEMSKDVRIRMEQGGVIQFTPPSDAVAYSMAMLVSSQELPTKR